MPLPACEKRLSDKWCLSEHTNHHTDLHVFIIDGDCLFIDVALHVMLLVPVKVTLHQRMKQKKSRHRMPCADRDIAGFMTMPVSSWI